MSRISGVEMQDNWKAGYALTKIKGIGWTLSCRLLNQAGVDGQKKVSDLSVEEINSITAKLEAYPTEGELSRAVRKNISRLQTIGAYRGLRHSRGLPTRGQRSRSNARTKRGKRKTVGSFKKDILAKTQKTGSESK